MRAIRPAVAVATAWLTCSCLFRFEDYPLRQDDGGSGAADASDGSGGFATGGAGGSDASDATACTGIGGVALAGEPCCEHGARACTGHAHKEVLVCDATTNLWTLIEACPGQKLCDTRPGATLGTCLDPVALCVGKQPGDTVCDGTTLVTCGPDLVTSTQAPCPFACATGVCVGTCVPGARACDDTTPQECDSAGAWHNEAPCPYVCTGEGQCSGTCLPASVQCSGSTPQQCDGAGVWQSGAACPALCENGQCVVACTEGAKQCSGTVPQTCQGGAWSDGPDCPYVCSAGACSGVCVPGAKQCTNLTPQTCSAAGQWQGGAPCPYVCQNGQCVGECVPGSNDCLGLTPRTCDANGTWQNEAPCAFVCSTGACTGVCVPGSKQCNGQTPQTCDASGQWVSGTPCPAACTAGTCTSTCTPGTAQCSGLVPQTCNSSGVWEDGAACPYVCSAGQCTGVCSPGSTQCTAQTPQVCSALGEWVSGTPCQYACSAGQCTGKSCAGMVGNECAGTNCCAALSVPTGVFPMGRSVGGTDAYSGGSSNEQPEHSVGVTQFLLDKYEVTVGRFRRFADAYDAWRSAGHPSAGEGVHPKIAGTGWQTSWNSSLATAKVNLVANLKCNADYQTWSDQAGSNENRPINCVSWYEAFAFCVWDGGRLPTEAEWEYAAAGGNQNRLYPWGASAPSPSLAVYGCNYGGSGTCTGVQNIAPVGSTPAGDGRWGQGDLAGSVREWTWDWYSATFYSTAAATGTDVANLTATSTRVRRGSNFIQSAAANLRAVVRFGDGPQYRLNSIGLRCARDGP